MVITLARSDGCLDHGAEFAKWFRRMVYTLPPGRIVPINTRYPDISQCLRLHLLALDTIELMERDSMYKAKSPVTMAVKCHFFSTYQIISFHVLEM